MNRRFLIGKSEGDVSFAIMLRDVIAVEKDVGNSIGGTESIPHATIADGLVQSNFPVRGRRSDPRKPKSILEKAAVKSFDRRWGQGPIK